jgi:hypothetical protein
MSAVLRSAHDYDGIRALRVILECPSEHRA